MTARASFLARRMPPRALTAGAAAACLASAVGLLATAPAHAGTLACNQNVEVQESAWDMATGCVLRPGDTVQISAAGSIWAGVWFTGQNGPQGWNNIANDSKFPKPSARAFSLLSKADGHYSYVGTGSSFTYTGPGTYLYLRINDDRPGNGNGAFDVNVQVFR